LKLEPNGQITVNIVLYGGTVLYGQTPSFQTDFTCTVLYGVIRYGTVITVKKAEVRRISTSLHIIQPDLFNMVKYVLNTVQHIIQIRRMTYPCLLWQNALHTVWRIKRMPCMTHPWFWAKAP